MTSLTMDPRKALRPEFAEGVINKKMEQQLDFLGLFPEVKTDAVSFSYFEDLTNAGADIASGKQSTPTPLGEITDLDEIEVSRITMKHGVLERFGYAMRFSKRSMREPAFIDEIARAYDRMAFGMAKKMNDDIVNTIKAVSNDITEVSGAAVWSGSTATPVEDVLSFVEASKIEGYPYELNNLYLHKTNYFELMKYLQGIDIGWVMNPLNGNREMPRVNGVNIHDLHSTQLAEGGYIGLDDRYPGLTVYQYLDPSLARMEGGRINVNRFEEEKFPYDTVIEVFAERGIATKVPNAISYKASGI